MTVSRSELSLEELAQLAQGGSEGERDAYFSELVERLSGRLRSFLLRKTGRAQDVDDLVQETFLRAYSNIERYQPKWRFTTWLYTIATRLAANQRRAQDARPALSAAEVHDQVTRDAHADDPAALVAQSQENAQLWRTAKVKLTDAQYTAIWLHYAQDMSVREIAEATGRTAIHVRVLLYRARRKLAEEVSCSAG